MNELTIILLILTVAFYVGSLILKRMEIDWLTLIVSVCGFCSLFIDESLTADPTALILLFVPYIFIFLMSAVRAMGIVKGGRA